MEFTNKAVIVTGGGTGIGRAVSRSLAGHGARVVVGYSRSSEEAEATVEEIHAAGGSAIAIKADIANEEEVVAMAKAAQEAFGAIDLLVNNAAITHHIPYSDLDAATEEVWEHLFSVNVMGTYRCCRVIAPQMPEGSAIVNIGSIAGITGLGSSIPYAVSKAAIHAMTKALAHALAPRTRVNCVAPGAVDTRWWAGNEERMRELAGNLPLGRITTPDEVAEVVLTALASPSMTGQTIVIDAGQSL